MASSSKSDNIILGPWAGSTKTAIKDTLSKEDKVSTDMDFIDKVAENVMIQLIHTLAENGVNITSKEFIRHIGFIDECIKSAMFNDMSYEHPLSELIKHLIGATKSKDNEKIFTSFKGDTMIDILEFLNGDHDE
tara:strand:- start:398 stop:799 length:402 start_codon:yes stop_codon:yes gene_type:complete